MAKTVDERHAVISHRIGADGTLVLRTVRGSVRMLGTDESEARVEVRYALPEGSASIDPEHDGVVRVSRGADELRIEADDTTGSLLNALGKMFSGQGPRVDFDVFLPRAATLRLSGVSANLDIHGLRGEQEIRTVSGDVSLVDVGGSVTLQTVSGDVSVHGTDLELRVTTTSGDLDVRVERLRVTRVRSVSGDIRLQGRFDPGPEHTIESISGDAEIAPVNGVTANMTSLSGSIHTDLPHRRESGRGKRRIIVGNGEASVTFRTMSGDLSIARGSGEVARTDETARQAPSRMPSTSAAADAPAAADSSQANQPPSASQPLNELDVLRALERGDIDVQAAARMLEELVT